MSKTGSVRPETCHSSKASMMMRRMTDKMATFKARTWTKLSHQDSLRCLLWGKSSLVYPWKQKSARKSFPLIRNWLKTVVYSGDSCRARWAKPRLGEWENEIKCQNDFSRGNAFRASIRTRGLDLVRADLRLHQIWEDRSSNRPELDRSGKAVQFWTHYLKCEFASNS